MNKYRSSPAKPYLHLFNQKSNKNYVKTISHKVKFYSVEPQMISLKALKKWASRSTHCREN